MKTVKTEKRMARTAMTTRTVVAVESPAPPPVRAVAGPGARSNGPVVFGFVRPPPVPGTSDWVGGDGGGGDGGNGDGKTMGAAVTTGGVKDATASPSPEAMVWKLVLTAA